MSEPAGTAFEGLVARLDRMMVPFAGKVAYGNLRTRASEWDATGDKTLNLAVIYESPGGSTNQINIAYRPRVGTFLTVDPEDGKETETTEPEQVVELVSRHIDTIPGYRLERLYQQIDEWQEAGYSRPHILAELNLMLQSKFRGGSVTQEELKKGLRYAVAALRGDKP